MAFCVKIRRTSTTYDATKDKAMTLIPTTQGKDDRLRAVKAIWELRRATFQRMSLRDLRYIDLPRDTTELAKSMPVSQQCW